MDNQHREQVSILERDVNRIGDRLDRHLEIYAQNGKELAGLKSEVAGLIANQKWLSKIIWGLMSPTLGGTIYLIAQGI